MSCAHTHPLCVADVLLAPLAAAGSASAIAMASDGQLHALVALYQATNCTQWHNTGGGQTGFAFVEFLALGLSTLLLALPLLSGWGARRRGRGLVRRLGRRCKPRRRSGPPPRALSLLAARACAVGRLSPLRPPSPPPCCTTPPCPRLCPPPPMGAAPCALRRPPPPPPLSPAAFLARAAWAAPCSSSSSHRGASRRPSAPSTAPTSKATP